MGVIRIGGRRGAPGRRVGREVGGPEGKNRDKGWIRPGGGLIPGPSRFM